MWKPSPPRRWIANLAADLNLGAGVDAVIGAQHCRRCRWFASPSMIDQALPESVAMHVLIPHRLQGYYRRPHGNSGADCKGPSDLRFGSGAWYGGTLPKCWAACFESRAGALTPKRAPGDMACGDAGFEKFSHAPLCGEPAAADAATHLFLLAGRFRSSRATESSAVRSCIMRGRGFASRGGYPPCLDDGTLLAATLDVFHAEPLPPDSPFWSHRQVTLSPHNAADTDPDAISVYVAEQIAAFERGEALQNVVDRGVGY